MLPTDTEASAREAARMFRDPRIRQYYDGERRLGIAYMVDVFPACIKEALAVLPEDNPLHERLKAAAASPANKEFALWDVVLTYPAGVKWEDKVPAPTAWSKQIMYWGPGKPGETTGTFWRNDCKKLPSDSDWAVEVRTLLKSLLP